MCALRKILQKGTSAISNLSSEQRKTGLEGKMKQLSLVAEDVKINVLMPFVCAKGMSALSLANKEWKSLCDTYLIKHAPKFELKEVLKSEHGQFSNPFFVNCDKEGNIYVSDYINHRIEVFNPIGKWTHSIECSSGPNGIAFNSIHFLVVAGFDSNSVIIYDQDMKFKKEFGSDIGGENVHMYHPRGIAIDSNDNIVVADTYNNQIQVFDRDGTWKQIIGKEGSGENEFVFPWDIAICKTIDRIFVSDCENHRIQVFSLDWKFLFQFGSEGKDNGQFTCPRGLALSNCEKYLLVCDSWNHRIQVFNTINCGFIKTYGSDCSSDAESNMEDNNNTVDENNEEMFTFPVGICVSPSGQIIISEAEFLIENTRVLLFE